MTIGRNLLLHLIQKERGDPKAIPLLSDMPAAPLRHRRRESPLVFWPKWLIWSIIVAIAIFHEIERPFMWHVCNPKSDDDLKQCAELGKSLSRMSQPTILTVLASSAEPLHGYVIVQKAAASPMFGGKKPDPAGIYRTLKKMEEQGFVTSEWDTPSSGAAKRLFSLTPEGRAALRRWIDALACYMATIQELREEAADALGIPVPPRPVCGGHE